MQKGNAMNINSLLQKMTLKEKLAQMSQYLASMINTDAESDITGPSAALRLSYDDIASTGSCLGLSGKATAKQIIDVQSKHLEADPHKIPLLFMRDVIHGYRTIYPIPLGMGAAFDEQLVYDCCRMAAKESAVSGIQVTFSPMVDLTRDCRWGRNMEGTGEDTWYNSKMGAVMVKGYQGDLTGKYDIAACVKHLAAYGAPEAGRDYNTTEISDHSLKEYYLPSYKASVDAGVKMVMTSFNTVNGIPSSANKWLVSELLRKEWGFDGIVISDWGALGELRAHGFAEDTKQAALTALDAGTDIEMMSSCFIHNLEALINEGKITEAQVDEAVLRILKLKDELGLFDDPYRSISPEEEEKYCLCDEHRALARKAAQKSAVLLKNEGVLPFKTDIKSIALIGPFANKPMLGSWACNGSEDEAVSVAQGVRNALPEASVVVEEGCSGELNAKTVKRLIDDAVSAARVCDCVLLCLGESAGMSGEGNSRADVSLPDAQKELIRKVVRANKNTAIVLFTGRPLALGDIIEDMPAVFTAWHPGTEGGNAIADLLFGKVNFSGHLTMSFPYHVGQAPIYYNHMRTGRPKPNEEWTQGYCSRYIDCPNRPLFPFGYGLSYTAFEYGDPSVSSIALHKGEKITASARIKNTGKVKGSTVAQLYIHDNFASYVRPVRELRGYQVIELEPGEERTVSFEIDEEMLAFHTNDGFIAEKGRFEVFITSDALSGKPVAFELK